MTVKLSIILVCAFLAGCQSVSDRSPSLSFIPVSAPGESISRTPFLSSEKGKNLLFSWQEPIDSITTALKVSTWQNEQWSTPSTVARGQHWFLNWADFPVVQYGPGDMVLSHFLKKSGMGTYHYDIMLMLSKDHGQNWESPFLLNTDNTRAEHGFVSMTQAGSRGVQVAWLDGRNTATGSDTTDHHGAMSLRTALVTPEGRILEESLLDERVCDCCQTDLTSLKAGPLLVYRDRDEQEFRDIAGFRYQHGEWLALNLPPDHWKIDGCPVNGPQVAALDNYVAIAWFTAPEGEPKVQWIRSNDGGKNFTAAAAIHRHKPLGRVDITVLPDYSSVITWMESRDSKSYLVGCRIDSTGEILADFEVAHLSGQRISGFPRIASKGYRVFWSWTDSDGPSAKTGYISFSNTL